jgi:hypothetical protein
MRAGRLVVSVVGVVGCLAGPAVPTPRRAARDSGVIRLGR